jgi:hypothetical protein
MEKSFSVIALVLLSGALILIGIVSGQRETKQLPVDATPIRLGVMTDRQREHSKHFNGLGGSRIPELLKKQDEVNLSLDEPLKGGEPGESRTVEQYLAAATCEADGVAIGTVLDKNSQLTDDQSFLFSDYTVRVNTTLKSPPCCRHGLADEIVVSRAGGAVILDNKLVTARNAAARDLVVGSEYLLFLRAGQSDDYIALPDTALVRPDLSIARPVGESGYALLPLTLDVTSDLIKTAAANGCH